MIDLIVGTCELLRPVLFFALLGYLPMKFGIGFDVAGNAPSVDDIRKSRDAQLRRISEVGGLNALLIPLRLLVVSYFTAWLLIDKSPLSVVALFTLTLIPIYFI